MPVAGTRAMPEPSVLLVVAVVIGLIAVLLIVLDMIDKRH